MYIIKVIILLFVFTFIDANECIKCHPKKMAQCKKSSHFTLKNSINITRTIWGVSNSDVTLQSLPKPKRNIHNYLHNRYKYINLKL